METVTPIPEGLDSAAATPILCAGVTTYKAVKQSNAKIGDWIAISGAGGGLGHLAVQYAVAMGLRVITIDTGASKRDLCVNQLGAEKWVDFMESKDLVKDVIEAAGGLGPQASCSARLSQLGPIPFSQALLYLRPAGTLVAVGMPAGGAMLNVPIALLVPRCINIVGSATGNRQDMAEALDIVAQGKVKCHCEVRDWEEVNDVLKDLRAGTVTGRVVLRIADPRRPNYKIPLHTMGSIEVLIKAYLNFSL
ncbi:NAD(P)-binding protein [Dendrothele bispora CBS 962.96]|uniref:NAD(P)-binding protein n=1 Tax=Dendrothele bispora (strain CBS 962.96) TaxID=1314807 RepID=A0A4S8LUZ3_DENBC|nr:NAD(P)-binding protein [Dendrothele bispora CBS 962.96]